MSKLPGKRFWNWDKKKVCSKRNNQNDYWINRFLSL